jgi:hypothetical protein
MHRLQQKVVGKVKLLRAHETLPRSAAKAAQVIFVPKSSDRNKNGAFDHERLIPFSVPRAVLEDFHAHTKESVMLYPTENSNARTLLVGLGENVDEVSLRDATHEAVAQLMTRGISCACLNAPSVASLSDRRVAELMTQARNLILLLLLILTLHRISRHLSCPIIASIVTYPDLPRTLNNATRNPWDGKISH